MPSVDLTDLGRLRLNTISFFLAVMMVCALGVKGIWNSFATEFERLPALGFRKAFGLVCLWGMLFVVVLTMISGARELMTPGAWQKNGFTYSLEERTDAALPRAALTAQDTRRDHLQSLWNHLSRFALANQGRFPSKRDAEVIPLENWSLPNLPTVRYQYLESQTADEDTILAFEPDVYGDGQIALMTTGDIRKVSPQEIRESLQQGQAK